MAAVIEIPSIEFYDGIARIDGLTLRSADTIELLKKMEPLEVESLIDSLLSTVAKIGEGATTAGLIVEEFREYINKKTREEFEGFRKELTESLKEIAKTTIEELKERNQDLSKTLEKNSKELEQLIERKIGEKLQEISEKIAVKEREEEIRERTTLKGLDFEMMVFEECKKMVDGTEEVADFVGNKPGTLKRKTGDILIRHSLQRGGIKPKTVVECKDKDLSNASAGEVLREIEEALANREADACLYLIRSEEQMPESFRPIKIGSNFVVASCDMDLGLLVRITKLVGSIECRIEASAEEIGVDLDFARRELKNIMTFLSDFNEIQRLSQLVSKHSKKIGQNTEKLKTKIENSVTKALESLEENLDENRNV
jgi:hypothetical protein